MTTLLQDLRYGFRMLVKSLGFSAIAVLTLALGIGANTAIFSIIDGVMFRSLPVQNPSQLVVLGWTAHKEPEIHGMSSFGDCDVESKDPSGCSFSYPFFETSRSLKDVFSSATAFAGPPQLVVSGHGAASMARGELVTGDYFSTLGVRALIGRTLGPDDDTVSASPAVVLSYAYWQSAFGGEQSAVGRTISLNSIPFTIVGVTGPEFTHLTPGKTQDMFLPLSVLPQLNIPWARDMKSPHNWWLVIVARLKPGVTMEKAQAAASMAFRNEMLHGDKPLSKAADNPSIFLSTAQQGLNGERNGYTTPLYILMVAVGLVLLIACANVAGLLLARASSRQKEMAIRLALGAGRVRIIRQLLTESVLLSVAGGGLGVLFAVWGVNAITAMVQSGPDNKFPFAMGPDWRILIFTLALSLMTGIVFGLAPAWRSTRLDLSPTLKENASSSPGAHPQHGRRLHLGKSLVVLQVALSMIVLVGAGLFVRTLRNLRNIDPGYDTRNLILFGIDPTLAKYKDERILTLYRELREKIAAIPGVISVSFSSDALLSGSLWTSSVHVEGRPDKSDDNTDMLSAGPDFFETLKIPLVGGRLFTQVDFDQAAQAKASEEPDQQEAATAKGKSAAKPARAEGPPIPVLINASFVHKYFSDKNPLGKHLTQGGSEGTSGDSAVGKPKIKSWEVIGIVGDAKYNNLRREIHPTVYVPLTGGGAHFEVRTAGNPVSFVPAVRKVVNDTDSSMPLFQVTTQTERIDELLTKERVISKLATFFGVIALLLACIGVYGLLSYEVARRTREIGIRMALGADRGDVLRRIAGQGFRVTLVGLIVGVAGGIGLTRFLTSLLYGLKATDPVTYTSVALILLAVALLASFIPARRATRVDPMVALRYE